MDTIQAIRVTIPPESIYRQQVVPALFTVAIRLSAEPQVLNADAVADRLKEIEEWDSNSDCPLVEIVPVMGRAFEYDNSPRDFKSVLLTVFETLLLEFGDISHVRKYVMDKVRYRLPKLVNYCPRFTSLSKRPLDPLMSLLNGYLNRHLLLLRLSIEPSLH